MFLKSSSGLKQTAPHWVILHLWCPVLLSQAASPTTVKEKNKVSLFNLKPPTHDEVVNWTGRFYLWVLLQWCEWANASLKLWLSPKWKRDTKWQRKKSIFEAISIRMLLSEKFDQKSKRSLYLFTSRVIYASCTFYFPAWGSKSGVSIYRPMSNIPQFYLCIFPFWFSPTLFYNKELIF